MKKVGSVVEKKKELEEEEGALGIWGAKEVDWKVFEEGAEREQEEAFLFTLGEEEAT